MQSTRNKYREQTKYSINIFKITTTLVSEENC